MKIEYKGDVNKNSKIIDLVKYLNNIDKNIWKYMGMYVEIDPTIDFNSHNVLIRWLDLEEGFNDKIIVNSLEEFKKHFKGTDD